MITLDGVVVLSDVYDMLVDLRNDLVSNEINLLKDIKYSVGKKDVMISCPVHKGGQENHASCGVTTTEVIRNGKQYPPGSVHCFNCGYTADFFEFVSLCWGTNDRNFGRRYILRKYNTMELNQRPDVKLNYQRTRPGKLPYCHMDESALEQYKYVSDYLYTRQFELNTILFYEYGYNALQNTITIPVRDHTGGLVFIKQRFINPPPGQDKYLNEKGIPKQYILYGFYQVLQLINAINNGTCTNKKLEENFKKYGIILVEGEFNASYLMQCGYPAVSLLGRILFCDYSKKTVQQLELLLRYGIRRLTIWMDNDEPGKEAQEKIINQTRRQFILHQPDYTMFPELNDANNYTPEQIDQLVFLPV